MVIDVAADSVGGACVLLQEGTVPALLYTHRVPIEAHEGEIMTVALARAVGTLGDSLIREGAPILLRAAGSGHPDRIVASIGAPWAESSVHIERFEGDRGGSFTFSRSLIEKALKPPTEIPAESIFMDETVVATFLDGYESHSPVGERARRSSIVVLSTVVEEAVAEPLARTLRALYHTHHVTLAAGSLVFYRSIESLFPHESDYLALAVSGDIAQLLLVRHDVLTGTVNVSLANDPTSALESAFKKLAEMQPLPHSIFLVTSESRHESFTALFADQRFSALWLSDNPPRILPIRPEHLQLGSKLGLVGAVEPDLRLSLIALFCAQPEA